MKCWRWKKGLFVYLFKTVSFPPEDKHVVNEHHVERRDATQKNALTWCISMYHVLCLKQTCGIKNVSLKVAKNSWVLWSTGKSNNQGAVVLPHMIFSLWPRKQDKPPWLWRQCWLFYSSQTLLMERVECFYQSSLFLFFRTLFSVLHPN